MLPALVLKVCEKYLWGGDRCDEVLLPMRDLQVVRVRLVVHLHGLEVECRHLLVGGGVVDDHAPVVEAHLHLRMSS